MEHTIKLMKETKNYKNAQGETRTYEVLYLVIDNFIKVRFDYASENYKNLYQLVKNGEKIIFKN